MYQINNIYLFIQYSTLNQYWNFIEIQVKMVQKKNNKQYIDVII